MIKQSYIVVLFYILFSCPMVKGEEIGILFIVDAVPGLGSNSSEQQQTQEELERFIFELNGYYEESGIQISAKLEHIIFDVVTVNGQVTNANTILSRMENNDWGFSELSELVERYGADYVSTIVNELTGSSGEAICGKAMRVANSEEELENRETGYHVMGVECDSDTFAHEIGHSMGLAHGNYVANCLNNSVHMQAIDGDAKGFGVGNCDGIPNFQTEFGTIMVGNYIGGLNAEGSLALKVPLFSSPNLTNGGCGINDICGDSFIANSVRALNFYRDIYSNREDRDVDTMVFKDSNLTQCISSGYQNIERNERKEIRGH